MLFIDEAGRLALMMLKQRWLQEISFLSFSLNRRVHGTCEALVPRCPRAFAARSQGLGIHGRQRGWERAGHVPDPQGGERQLELPAKVNRLEQHLGGAAAALRQPDDGLPLPPLLL